MTTSNTFQLFSDQMIPELKTRARFYRHIKTGAELLSLENEDENKVFGVTFRTPPPDSTGLPHIMEHSVLCGSRKYPVKEPFVELMKGSLNTFLNAFTGSDKTMYPVASQNLQDFYNLIDVYLDAVFYPLISKHTFQQEGWHYELEDGNALLNYKGVVFNEMKGAYSSPDNLLGRYSQQSLFPDHIYGFDSGGDPKVIPDLTYQHFKEFHETYYHPSNARIYFYGNDDPQKRLDLIDQFLVDFNAIEVDSAIPIYPTFTQPNRLTVPYDIGEQDQPETRKGMLSLNWVLPGPTDPEMVLGFQILSHILISTPASPLRKALIDSGLGEDLTRGGLDDELRQMVFTTGLKGIAVEDAEKVERLVNETLQKLVDESIDPQMVAAAVNTIEFRLRENNTGSFPQGLLLMMRALMTWLYDDDPVKALAFEAPLAAIKTRLENGEPYFESLIRTHLLDNPHRSILLLKPDPEIRQKQEAVERKRLEAIREGMSSDQLQEVLENTRQLKKLQETPDSPEALATIPLLSLDDVQKEIRRIPLEVSNLNGAQLLLHDLFTNGILYLDVGFNLHLLPPELLPYTSLFGRALVEIGTEKEDFVRLSQRIGRDTGGIRATSFTSAIRDRDHAAAWLFLRGKATLAQAGALMDILGDVLHIVQLDNRERFKQMVLEEKAGLETQLIPAGHRMVNLRLRSLFDEAGWAAEQINGISYLYFLRDLAEQVEQDWPSVLDKLESLRKLLVNASQMVFNVTIDKDSWKQIQPQLENFCSSLTSAPSTWASWQPARKLQDQGLIIPAQVNYVGKGENLYRLGYSLNGSVLAIVNYLRATWIWERVRVQGGAYGGYSLFDLRSGVFTFLSYRDPNLLDTLRNYDGSSQFLKELDTVRLSKEELTKAILGAIGEMDAYQLPDAKGYSSMLRHLVGESDDTRQLLRDQLLATKLEDFHAFGEALERMNPAGKVVVMGSAEAIQAATEQRHDWLDIQRVL